MTHSNHLETYFSEQGFTFKKGYQFGSGTAVLVETAIRNQEGLLSKDGALVVETGKHTGRSPNDKYIVASPELGEIWWGKINQPISLEGYEYLRQRMLAHLNASAVHIQDIAVGQDPKYRQNVRLVSTQAWCGLFCLDLFIPRDAHTARNESTDITILHAPELQIDPPKAGIRSETFIVLNIAHKTILIGGTAYAGEVKKSVFSLMNYLMPEAGVLPMHCSANVGHEGDVALFFGLSGTGKTTLSSTPDRELIGDDEHGWSSQGIFNFEGGCYAKTIRLKKEFEPLIWQAVHRFGTLIENVDLDPSSRLIDFDSDRLTENTRAAYPLRYIDNHFQGTTAGHPKNVFFLTADASGVLPPITKLSAEQAMYYFLAGYTSKLAGTEVNLGSQPQATFSSCFAAPFLPLHPMVYAAQLGERIKQHHTAIWLINTGWSGGTFGVGKRIHLPHTRAMIQAALNGDLTSAAYHQEPFFNLLIPDHCPGVPDTLLDPRASWADKSAYDSQAKMLAQQFHTTMEQYRAQIPDTVFNAGPGATG